MTDDVDLIFKDFPPLIIKLEPLTDSDLKTKLQINRIELGYGSVRVETAHSDRLYRFVPRLLARSGNEGGLSYLLSDLRESFRTRFPDEIEKLCEYLKLNKDAIDRWLEDYRKLFAEGEKRIEHEKVRIEQERLRIEEERLRNEVPKSVSHILQYNVQKDRVKVIGRIKERSLPLFAVRNDIEYTAYNLLLEDLDESSSRVPIYNLPVGDYDKGDIIAVAGEIIRKHHQKKNLKAINGIKYFVEEPKVIPSDPLEKIRILVFGVYRSAYPNELVFAKVLEGICDSDPKAAKIIDPFNRRIFTIEETIPKRLMKICCENRPSDDGYLIRSVRRTPLTLRWEKKSLKEHA